MMAAEGGRIDFMFLGPHYLAAGSATVMADRGGRGRQGCVPPSSISFIFMQFSAKVLSNNRFLPPSLGLAPAHIVNLPQLEVEFLGGIMN